MKKTTLALTLIVGIVTGVQASIIESDDFTYNDGPVAQPTASVSNPSSTWFANTGSAAGKESWYLTIRLLSPVLHVRKTWSTPW